MRVVQDAHGINAQLGIIWTTLTSKSGILLIFQFYIYFEYLSSLLVQLLFSILYGYEPFHMYSRHVYYDGSIYIQIYKQPQIDRQMALAPKLYQLMNVTIFTYFNSHRRKFLLNYGKIFKLCVCARALVHALVENVRVHRVFFY